MLLLQVTYTVREFVERAFKVVDIDLVWEGEGVNEKGINKSTGEVIVQIDEKYFRPAEVELLWGDPSLANKELGWVAKTSLDELILSMVTYDLNNDDFGGIEII